MELLNVYAQQKKHPLDSFESSKELEFSANSKNKFLVTSNSTKWLAIDVTLYENDGTTKVHLIFRQRTFTVIFQLVIFLALLTQVIFNPNGRFELLAFLLVMYLINLIHFNWRAHKVKGLLNQILR